MNALTIAYPTFFDRTSIVEDAARKCGYEVETHTHEKPDAHPTGDERCVRLTRADATPEDYADFAADLGAMGVPDPGRVTGCRLTVYAGTVEELDEAREAFRAHGFTPNAELTTG